MSNFTLKPIHRQVFQVQPEQSHPRLSLRRVLWVKFLRWVEQSPSQSLLRALIRCSIFLLVFCGAVAPSFMAGLLTATAKWSGYRVPTAIAVCLIAWNVPRFVRFVMHWYVKRRRSQGNQYTYEGIPLDELTTYLFERRTFSTEAINDLAMSQRKWRRIAEQLEHHGILTRGENNSRVLAQISREELVRQLRDGFPLVFDPVGNQWCERRGKFDTWCLQKDRQEAREKQRIERMERKKERLQRSVQTLQEEGSRIQALFAA